MATEDDYRDWTSDDDDGIGGAAGSLPPNFAEFVAAVQAGIADLGGAVFPKLTWSCPKDAAWMTVGNSLRCDTADQVMLLLKSSDRVAHDVGAALAECDDTAAAAAAPAAAAGSTPPPPSSGIPRDAHVLALRKWYDLKPGREFRCFVRGHELVGISQRDVTRRYPEVEVEAATLHARILEFHRDAIHRRFPQQNYTYDCYVPSSTGSAVRVVDFNPAGGTTTPLLFEWAELAAAPTAPMDPQLSMEAMAARAEFRIIREDVAMRPESAVFGVPYDFVDGSEGSALSALLEQTAAAAAGGELWESLQHSVDAARIQKHED